VTGLVFYFMGASEKSSPSNLAFAPGPHGASMVWSCGF
jgi:hypothetical protein